MPGTIIYLSLSKLLAALSGKSVGSLFDGRFESGNDAGEFALSKVPEGIICNFAKIFEGMILGILQKARSITYFPALHGDSGTVSLLKAEPPC